MIVEFLEEAEQELMDAVLWYESKEAGLGKRLRVDETIPNDAAAANR